MNQIQKNDALRLLPGLDTLTPYRNDFNEILHILETSSANKIQEIEEYEKGINQFLIRGPQIIRNHIQAVRSQRCIEGKKNTLQVFSPQSKLQRTKQKINGQKSFQNSKSSTEIISPRTDLADEILLIKQMLKKRRSAKLSKQFNDKLVRNSQNCQLFTHLQNLSLSSNFKFKFTQNRFWMCKYCDFFQRSEYQNNNHSDVMQNHFNTCHPKIVYRPNLCIQFYYLSEAYQKLTEKTEKFGNKYYKCNCQIRPCKSSSEYCDHIKNTHNNEIPPYSSHIYNQSHDLVVNPNFDQHCVIQDIISHQTYYCGECKISFDRRPEIFYHHLLYYHQGKTTHPFTSHLLKQNPCLMGQSKFKTQATLKQPNHEPITKHKPTATVLTEKRRPGRQPKINKEQFQPKQKHAQTLNQKTPLFSVQLKARPSITGKVKLTQKYQNQNFKRAKPFCEEQKMMKIIKDYKGPFICSVCENDFQNYDNIAEHFNSGPSLSCHLRKQKNWMRVRIKKVNENEQYYHFLPITEEYNDIQFLVPSLSQLTLSYFNMNYAQFIDHSRLVNMNYNSYLWLHYSEYIPCINERNGGSKNDKSPDRKNR